MHRRIQTMCLESLHQSPDCSPGHLLDTRHKLKWCCRWWMVKSHWAAGSYCTLSEEQICFCHNDRVQHHEYLWGDTDCMKPCTIILLIYMIHEVETKLQIHRRQIKVVVEVGCSPKEAVTADSSSSLPELKLRAWWFLPDLYSLCPHFSHLVFFLYVLVSSLASASFLWSSVGLWWRQHSWISCQSAGTDSSVLYVFQAKW